MTTITIDLTYAQIDECVAAMVKDKAFDETVKQWHSAPTSANLRIFCYRIARDVGFGPTRPGTWRLALAGDSIEFKENE